MTKVQNVVTVNCDLQMLELLEKKSNIKGSFEARRPVNIYAGKEKAMPIGGGNSSICPSTSPCPHPILFSVSVEL